jgi:predicted deacylase
MDRGWWNGWSRPSAARASHSGILRSAKSLGARVKKQEVLGWISDPLGSYEVAV